MTTAWDDLAAENAFLRRELEARDAGILECQTRMLALERELVEMKGTLTPEGECPSCIAFQDVLDTVNTERDEAHAAIRWLMARFHPYVNVPIEHAPAIRRASEGK